jgi:hypothetical protein
VVVQQEGGAMIARIGDPVNWVQPTRANLVDETSWSPLAFKSSNGR